MAFFDILRFDTAPVISEDDFRAADTAMQHWCYRNLPGIQRRTTARRQNHCIVVQLFDDLEHCGAAYLDSTDDDVVAWVAMIDRSSVTRETYELF